MTKKIFLRPKCLTGEQSYAYTNRGHLIPCCYCDTINSYKDPNFKKLLAVSKVSEHESIEDIIMQNEWLEFEENLREQNLDKVLRTCIKTCQVREDKEDVVRRETYIEPDGEKKIRRI